MSDASSHEPAAVDPEFASIVQTIERDYVARYGTDAAAEQLARRAYAYLDIRQFTPLWTAAVRAHLARHSPASP